MKKKSVHYVDNEKLFNELVEHSKKVKLAQENGTELPRYSDYIGMCILLIAENIAQMKNFSNYTFVDNMISDGVENCLKYLHNFDPNKTQNPFAYITRIIYFAFVRRIMSEKKDLYVKYKLMANYGIYSAIVDNTFQPEVYDNLYEFIEKFENSCKTKMIRKKEKTKKKGLENFIDGDEFNSEIL